MMQLQAVQGTRYKADSSARGSRDSGGADFAALLQGGVSRTEPEKNTAKDIEKEETPYSGKDEGKVPEEETYSDSGIKKETKAQEKQDNPYLLNQLMAFVSGQFMTVGSPEMGEGQTAFLPFGQEGISPAAGGEGQENAGEVYEVFGREDGLSGFGWESSVGEDGADPVGEQEGGEKTVLTQEPISASAEEETLLTGTGRAGEDGESGEPSRRNLENGGKSGNDGAEELLSAKNSREPEGTFSAAAGQVSGQALQPAGTGEVQFDRLGQDPLFREESMLHLKTSRTELVQDTASLLASRFPAKGGTLEVELEPAYMGRLTIRVAFEGGKTAVTVLASDQRTLDILSQNAGQIAQILEERTGQQTMVYTPGQADNGQPEQEGRPDHQKGREDGHRGHDREQDSFAQQLRLGLV